jgi:hypothetical protein
MCGDGKAVIMYVSTSETFRAATEFRPLSLSSDPRSQK